MNDVNVGDRFGKLTVVENVFHTDKHGHNKPYCRCICDCGTKRDISKYSLLKGRSKSCGCMQSSDVIGKRFGMLTAVQWENNSPGRGKHKTVLCKCECGNSVIVRASDLRSGAKTDCGCRSLKKQSDANLNDLTGMRFGDLTVLCRDESAPTGGGRHAHWLCRCEKCGSVTSVSNTMLVFYKKDRCSKCIGDPVGEAKIKDILDSSGVQYEHDTSYRDCVYPETNYHLRFDFVVHDNTGDYIIEYDGIQHFKEVGLWEQTTDLSERIKRDQYKNDWCKRNGIPIIRIPYTHLNEICVDDLIPESSTFVIYGGELRGKEDENE